MEYKIEKLSDLIYDNANFEKFAEQIYYLTDHLSCDYPNHYQWFFQKHIPFVGKIPVDNEEREVLFIRNHGNICGISCLKKSEKEKKICTFYVAEHGRNIGIGRTLMTESIIYLGTETPMITMPAEKVTFFLHFIYQYNWKITQIEEDYYVKGNDEVVFNGTLEPVTSLHH